MVSARTLQKQLTRLAQAESTVMSAVLGPRIPGGLNDVLIAYYSSLMSEPSPTEPLPPIDRLCVALDIVLRNHGLSFDQRKTVIVRLREICQQSPELLATQGDPASTESLGGRSEISALN